VDIISLVPIQVVEFIIVQVIEVALIPVVESITAAGIILSVMGVFIKEGMVHHIRADIM
jgi:hypothetical protein